MLQTVPPQNQPVEEQTGATMDWVWYRFFSSLFSNVSDNVTNVTDLTNNLANLTTKVNSLPTNPLVFVPVPLHNTSPGTAGQVAFDSGFFYICIAPSSWARVAIGGAW
jgi:hypothetical protein